MIGVRKICFISVDRYGEVLPLCARCMKTHFKATLQTNRRLKCHGKTNHVDKVNQDLELILATVLERQAAKHG